MNPLALYGALGAASAALLTGAYVKGRSDAALKCEQAKAESAIDANRELERDANSQREAGAISLEDYRRDMAAKDALIRRLTNEGVEDGDVCNSVDDGQRVWDAYDAIFAGELPAAGGVHGEE